MKVLTAFCDLELCPVSFDFITWGMRAMIERDRIKADHLHIVLVPYEKGAGGFARYWGEHDVDAARWRLWNIVIASAPLMGATVTLAINRAQAELLKVGDVWWPEKRAHLTGELSREWFAGNKFTARLRATAAPFTAPTC